MATPRCSATSSLASVRPSPTAGIYVGEGLLPVPAKLAEKITRWELRTECWSSFGPKESVSAPGTRYGGYRHKRAVTDIATWVQCFATYVSVISTPHPQAVPELLAYLIFILRASQDFGGVAWVTYDAAFRRQAFITGNQQWSKVNPSLYSICFSGVARTGQRCELCLSLSHPTSECTMVNDPDPDVSARLKTLESAVLAFTSHSSPQQGLIPRTRSPIFAETGMPGGAAWHSVGFGMCAGSVVARTLPWPAAIASRDRGPARGPQTSPCRAVVASGRDPLRLTSLCLAIVALGRDPRTSAISPRGRSEWVGLALVLSLTDIVM